MACKNPPCCGKNGDPLDPNYCKGWNDLNLDLSAPIPPIFDGETAETFDPAEPWPFGDDYPRCLALKINWACVDGATPTDPGFPPPGVLYAKFIGPIPVCVWVGVGDPNCTDEWNNLGRGSIRFLKSEAGNWYLVVGLGIWRSPFCYFPLGTSTPDPSSLALSAGQMFHPGTGSHWEPSGGTLSSSTAEGCIEPKVVCCDAYQSKFVDLFDFDPEGGTPWFQCCITGTFTHEFTPNDFGIAHGLAHQIQTATMRFKQFYFSGWDGAHFATMILGTESTVPNIPYSSAIWLESDGCGTWRLRWRWSGLYNDAEVMGVVALNDTASVSAPPWTSWPLPMTFNAEYTDHNIYGGGIGDQVIGTTTAELVIDGAWSDCSEVVAPPIDDTCACGAIVDLCFIIEFGKTCDCPNAPKNIFMSKEVGGCSATSGEITIGETTETYTASIDANCLFTLDLGSFGTFTKQLENIDYRGQTIEVVNVSGQGEGCYVPSLKISFAPVANCVDQNPIAIDPLDCPACVAGSQKTKCIQGRLVLTGADEADVNLERTAKCTWSGTYCNGLTDPATIYNVVLTATIDGCLVTFKLRITELGSGEDAGKWVEYTRTYDVKNASTNCRGSYLMQESARSAPGDLPELGGTFHILGGGDENCPPPPGTDNPWTLPSFIDVEQYISTGLRYIYQLPYISGDSKTAVYHGAFADSWYCESNDTYYAVTITVTLTYECGCGAGDDCLKVEVAYDFTDGTPPVGCDCVGATLHAKPEDFFCGAAHDYNPLKLEYGCGEFSAKVYADYDYAGNCDGGP